MLLKKSSQYIADYNKWILETNNIYEINYLIEDILNNKCLGKYLKNIIRKYIDLLEESVYIDIDIIEKTYEIFWHRSYLEFRYNYHMISEFFDTLGSYILKYENYSKIYNYKTSDDICISFIGFHAPSINLYFKNEYNRDLIYASYFRQLFMICNTFGYEFDYSLLREIFFNMDFDTLISFSNIKTHKIELIYRYIEKIRKNELFSNNSNFLKNETLLSFILSFSKMIDIWDNKESLGKDTIFELQKFSYYSFCEDNDIKEINNFILKFENCENFSNDIFLLYKNISIIVNNDYDIESCIKKSLISYIKLNNIQSNLSNFLQCVDFIINFTLFKSSKNNFEKENIQHICQKIINDIKNMSFSEILDKGPSNSTMIDNLLGIFDDVDFITIESLNKKPRNAQGRFIKKTKGIKSIGMSITHAFDVFNKNRKQIEGQMDNGFNALKDALFGADEVKTAVVEGKKFSISSLLKKMLGLVCLFSFGKVKAVLFLIIRACARGKIKKAERRRIIQDIEEELLLIEEKINDANADGNRKAKYSLMRTKSQLEHALERIKYGMEAADDSSTIQQIKQK